MLMLVQLRLKSARRLVFFPHALRYLCFDKRSTAPRLESTTAVFSINNSLMPVHVRPLSSCFWGPRRKLLVCRTSNTWTSNSSAWEKQNIKERDKACWKTKLQRSRLSVKALKAPRLQIVPKRFLMNLSAEFQTVTSNSWTLVRLVFHFHILSI